MSDPFMTAVGLIGNTDLTDEKLTEIMGVLAMLPMFKDMDLEPTRRRLEAMLGISMSPGEGLSSGENQPWVEDIKGTVEWHYWDAYIRHLRMQGFTDGVIRTLDEDTDNILTECGNPTISNPWRIQGLVMGDVQSGKTANYSGLISKAADSGYRIIVLLTGMIEELRSQSQARLDEGFVGKDSSEVLAGTQSQPIGAGVFHTRSPNVLTSVMSDFLTGNQQALRGIPLQNIAEPVLLVMKKNTTPLKRLMEFLGRQMQSGQNQLDVPLLLIDDESDNASVNAKSDENPAAINALIRELLGKFRRASYVGYTATPFANVFINPDPGRADLFPSNFIYSLKSPTSYIGAASIFSDEGEYSNQLVDIDDAAVFFPDKHKKTLPVTAIPNSMKDAIRTFLISCAIRDLRKEPLKHRSMLINVTRFTDVQKALAEVVNDHLFRLLEDIKQYAADDDLWRNHEPLVELESSFRNHYSGAGVTWNQVRRKLYESCASVKVLTINQKTDSDGKLNYRHYNGTEKGRRVIAIGGLTLSRGLTLEGLCVSYFYRNSKAYDTLLQMGRWFGYRFGYDDLCRIWMAPEIQDWFAHIAQVVSELRSDIRRMHANRQPPSQFGIRVRSHPDTLLVTAANKMRNSEEVSIDASFSGAGIETAYLPKSRADNKDNADATALFLSKLGDPDKIGNRLVWRDVDKSEISNYLRSLKISPMNTAFLTDAETGDMPLVSYISENDVDALMNWDVCLPQGQGDVTDGLCIPGNSAVPNKIKRRQRQFERRDAKPYLVVNKQRVGEAADEKIGMSNEQIDAADKGWLEEDPGNAKKSIPAYAYRKCRQKPLLTIHPIQPSDALKRSEKNFRRILPASEIEPDLLIALSLSFPNFEEEDRKPVVYRLNRVYLENIGLVEEIDQEDEDDND